ncbi:MAG: hypothetical protein EZS28_013380 [Streblomastix strix]|uniref:Uncharacterized protein n=1 Tax=Streblomastix strix TaxID=222440 RepID=A0A5J4W8S3_9EUKA|nr:MAG: hypothetical protein EZS28_013380 [Streblomastix strix]
MEPVVEPVVAPKVEPAARRESDDIKEPAVEALKQGKPRKYQTEEEANEKARLQRKQFKQRLREKQKVFKSGIYEVQLSAQKLLNKVVLSKEDLIRIFDIIEWKKELVDQSVQTI